MTPFPVGSGDLDLRQRLIGSYEFIVCQSLGEGKEIHNPTARGQSMQNTTWATPVKGVPQTTRLREDKRLSAHLYVTVRIEPLE